jgi:hypothetical protein
LVDAVLFLRYNTLTLNSKGSDMQAVTFNTNGTGYWSNTAKAVRITDMRLGYVSDEKDFGELCVYFNTEDWDVNALGLIYTDKQFKAELNAFLVAQGLCAVEYSEQGMQGEDYVSCDVGGDFITAWERKFDVVLEAE